MLKKTMTVMVCEVCGEIQPKAHKPETIRKCALCGKEGCWKCTNQTRVGYLCRRCDNFTCNDEQRQLIKSMKGKKYRMDIEFNKWKREKSAVALTKAKERYNQVK